MSGPADGAGIEVMQYLFVLFPGLQNVSTKGPGPFKQVGWPTLHWRPTVDLVEQCSGRHCTLTYFEIDALSVGMQGQDHLQTHIGRRG